MADLFDSSDDIDDEIPDFDTDNTDGSSRENAAHALAHLALEAALNRQSRAVLKRHPSLSIVMVPARDWVPIIAATVKRMDQAPVVRTAIEKLRQGGVHYRVGEEELAYLRQGRSVLYISQDPDTVLHEAVLAAADVTISIPAMNPALLRKLIRRVTGKIARGVTAAMAELALPVILSVVRPERSARQCVANLERALARRPEPTPSSVPLLSELPLTKTIRTWSDQVLADLAAVEAGTLPPDQVVFGLLEGPPGTGKTLIAESLARTAGWSFVPSSIGAWFASGDGALGGVSKNLKSFMDEVLVNEPAIGFMDELDALPNRATMDNRGRDWWTPLINLFLTEIDRVRKSGRKVLLLGATNYYDRLDSALIRPGRLQQRVSVLPPRSEAEVVAVLRYYLKTDLADIDLSRFARVGRDATPAMIEGWVKEGRSFARSFNRPLEPGDILVQMVPRDDRSPQDIRSVAIHEMGHAIVAHRLGQVVESVSIIADAETGGRTWTRLASTVPTWQGLLDIAAVTLGGRAADIVLGLGPNAGAEGDLASATDMILSAYERQGLRDDLVFAPALGIRSAGTFAAVNAELRRQLKRAMIMVEADRHSLLELAQRLIEEKVLSGDDVARALDARPLQPGPKRVRSRKAQPVPVSNSGESVS